MKHEVLRVVGVSDKVLRSHKDSPYLYNIPPDQAHVQTAAVNPDYVRYAVETSLRLNEQTVYLLSFDEANFMLVLEVPQDAE